MKQYPAIYKSEDKSIYLYSDKGNYYCFTREFWDESEDMDNHESDTNITREYLSNTWGEVESKEHAEFIVELAKLHGFKVIKWGEKITHFNFRFVYGEISLNLLGFGFYKDDLKQITIPLPPKVEVSEAGHNLVFAASECKEWPCVNDDVLIDMSGYDVVYGRNVDGLICKVLSIFKDDDTTVYAVNRDGVNYCFIRDLLKKPKTPEEELRDEVSELICKSNEQWLNSKGERQITIHDFIASHLLTKYNITPKD